MFCLKKLKAKKGRDFLNEFASKNSKKLIS